MSSAHFLGYKRGRLEVRRSYTFGALDCLLATESWPDQKSFFVIESTREIDDKKTYEHFLYQYFID